jgi:hypothetical protein
MASTKIKADDARDVAFAYGNYRTDLALVDHSNAHSIRVYMSSADALMAIQENTDFYIIGNEEITHIKKFFQKSLDRL